MMWFQRARLRRSRCSSAKVDSEQEAVSDGQLSSTCVAAVVGSGTAHLLLADGSRVLVPQQTIERSAVLVDLANTADLASAVVVGGRAQIQSWFQYVQLTEREKNSCSWISLLRSLLAVDILADDVAVWDLANRLGFVVTRAVAADIGADGALNSGTPHGCRQQKQNLPSCSTILSELPDHLAAAVLSASAATLHECMTLLPQRQHACALEALCTQRGGQQRLHIAGRETAKLQLPIHSGSENRTTSSTSKGSHENCNKFSSCGGSHRDTITMHGPGRSNASCSHIDTIALACSAASTFTGILNMHLSSMYVHASRATALAMLLVSLPKLEDLQFSCSDFPADALDALALGISHCTALTSFQMSDCCVFAPPPASEPSEEASEEEASAAAATGAATLVVRSRLATHESVSSSAAGPWSHACDDAACESSSSAELAESEASTVAVDQGTGVQNLAAAGSSELEEISSHCSSARSMRRMHSAVSADPSHVETEPPHAPVATAGAKSSRGGWLGSFRNCRLTQGWLRSICVSNTLTRTLSDDLESACKAVVAAGATAPMHAAHASARAQHDEPSGLTSPASTDSEDSENIPEYSLAAAACSRSACMADSDISIPYLTPRMLNAKYVGAPPGSGPPSQEPPAATLVHALSMLPKLEKFSLTDVTLEGPDIPVLPLLENLSKLQSLKHLTLNKVGLSHVGVTDLASSLATMHGIEEVVVLGYRISGWPVQVLGAALANLTNLQRLELELGSVSTGVCQYWSSRSTPPSSRPCLEFSSALASLSRLRYLHLRGYLGTEGLDTLCDALPSLTSLEHIILCESRYCFTYPNGLQLCQHLARMSKLSSVTFTNVDLHSDGSVSLAATLAAHQGLKKLVLGFSKLMETALWVPAVMPAVKSLLGLEHLGMSTCVDSAGTADALAMSLSNLPCMQRLRLHVAFSSDEYAQVVLAALSHLTKLTDLRLCTIGIDTDGAHMLCSSLALLTDLELLSLRRDGVAPSSVIHISPALLKLQKLKHLELAFSSTFRDRNYCFAEALASLSQLTYLTTSGVQLQLCGMHVLTPATSKLTNLEVLGLKNVAALGVRSGRLSNGISGVAEFIRMLPKLRVLHLANSFVGDSGMAVLAQSLTRQYCLRELDVSRTGITDSGASVLLQALENIYVRRVIMHGNRGIVNKRAEVFKRHGVYLEDP